MMPPEVPVVGDPSPLSVADPTRTGRGTLVWWLIAAVVLADQVTKILVQHYIPVFDSVTVVPGLIDLVHIRNAGVAFGLMNDMDHPYRSALTLALPLAALAGIVYYARQVHPSERLARIGLSLILGGAVGNLIDRVRLGHVVDFIDVYQGTVHFWAFNVADAAISCGAVLIFIEILFAGRHAPHSV
jgi:signal peptidase II